MQFAGHPVLGTAWVLAQPLQRGVVELETGIRDRAASRSIATSRVRSSSAGCSSRSRPSSRSTRPSALLSVLGVERSELPVELYDNGATHIVVTLASEDAVAALCAGLVRDRVVRRHRRQLRRRRGRDAGRAGCSGRCGEDAATGSAAGPIACHLCRHGLVEWGEWIEISQGAEIGRPSTLFARADGAGGEIVGVFCGGARSSSREGEFRL